MSSHEDERGRKNTDSFFKRFSLLEDKEYTHMKGSGFGLSCVKTIAGTMNGNATLSRKGEGCVPSTL